MKRKELKLKIKEDQKRLARKIKEQKSKRKESPNGYVHGLDYNSREYRHKHIAYCMMFNKTPYDLIERPREDNKPSKHLVDGYKEGWKGLIDDEQEIICHSS